MAWLPGAAAAPAAAMPEPAASAMDQQSICQQSICQWPRHAALPRPSRHGKNAGRLCGRGLVIQRIVHLACVISPGGFRRAMADALPSPSPRVSQARFATHSLPAYRPVVGAIGWRVALRRPLTRGWTLVTAPLLGRAPLFPWRLASAVHRRDGTIPLRHAERFFGLDLRLEVDPNRLCWQLMDRVTDGHRVRYLAHTFLDGGDWSGAREALAGSVVQQEMAALLDLDRPLKDSPVYRYMLARIAEGKPEQRNAVRLATPALVDAYFAHYRDLAARIRAEGFLSREALNRRFSLSPLRSVATEWREGEVGIAIGPDGELFRLLGGRHRTALAQLLGLPRIPVRVRLVHAVWLRGEIDRQGIPAHQALLAGLRGLAG